MAVDTAAKRFSMLNFGEMDVVLAPPDGSVDAGDRAHYLGLYAGITLDAPSVSYVLSDLSYLIQHHP